MDQRAPHGSNWTMQAILCAGVVIWRSHDLATAPLALKYRRSRAG